MLFDAHPVDSGYQVTEAKEKAMKHFRNTEVRTVNAEYVTPDYGTFFVSFGGTGRFRHAVVLPGTVKIVRLKNGDYSFRSIGRKGNGGIVHVSGDAAVAFEGNNTDAATLWSYLTNRVWGLG